MTSIIIVDDHQIIRDCLTDMLSKQGFKILATASNGKQFLSILETQVPDVVILDIAMPEMDGYEATIKAIEKHPDLKILILS